MRNSDKLDLAPPETLSPGIQAIRDTFEEHERLEEARHLEFLAAIDGLDARFDRLVTHFENTIEA